MDPAGLAQDVLEEFVAQGLEVIIARALERGEAPPDLVLEDDAVQDLPTRFVPPSDEEVREMGAELDRHGQAARAVQDHVQDVS